MKIQLKTAFFILFCSFAFIYCGDDRDLDKDAKGNTSQGTTGGNNATTGSTGNNTTATTGNNTGSNSTSQGGTGTNNTGNTATTGQNSTGQTTAGTSGSGTAGASTTAGGTGSTGGSSGPSLGKSCGSRGGVVCGKSEFCDNGGHCSQADKPGTCKKRPQACNRMYDPVCGCDGKDYSNPCVAQSMGSAVKSKGKCSGSGGNTCSHNGKTYKLGETYKVDCNTCTCGANGMANCTKMACGNKNCTYNGNVYKPGDKYKMDCNTCTCGNNGMAMCTKIACPPSPKKCTGPNTCSGAKEFCSYPVGDCGFSGKDGQCKQKPGVCTSQYDPVCGCDGNTYSNSCAAAGKGVPVKQKGKCAGKTRP